MPSISATRHEVSDRFEVLGFTIKTGRKPYFQVVLVSDLDALRDKEKRTRATFWASNPVAADRGEAVFLVPPEVVKRFAGRPWLRYGLATFADANRSQPEIVSEPNEGSPWINLGAYTGRSHRRAMTLYPRRRDHSGNGYGGGKPEELEWAGDLARPGTESIAPKGEAPGNEANGNGSAAQAPLVAAPSAESSGFIYDDGFGTMPLETIEAEEEYGIEEPLEEGAAIAQGLGHGRAFTATPEYPGASSFVEARHFRRPNQPRTINRIVIHITDGHGPARGTADYFSDPQRWYRVDEEDGQLQMEMEGDRCVRFRTGGKWKDCVNGRTKVQGGPTMALARVPVSAHYVVGQDGEAIQMVRNADIAYHASSANGDSIGIEHGARKPKTFGKDDAGLFPSEDQYRASALLVCWLAHEFGVPKDREHILGHSEADPRTSHTACPNSVWDWDHYMTLLTDGSCEPAPASAPAAQSYSAAGIFGRAYGAARPRALSGESFAVFWSDVELVPQMTNMSCWAASASMVVGWRDRISIDPQEIANGTGVWGAYKNGLRPRDRSALADAWGLVKEEPQSYTVEGWRELLEQNGPLWVGVAVPSGHAVVVTGLFGDGTPEGTTVRYNDPWPPGQGAEKQTKSFAAFIREYENRITTNGGTVNVQVLHAGGERGRQASTTQSYAGALEFTAFDPSAVDRMRQEFEANVAAGSPKSCIIITNAALRQLNGPALKNADGTDKALATTIQDTMAKLESYGLAQSPTVFEFNDASGRLTKGVARPETLQQSIEEWLMSGAERNQASGWYNFGLSIMDGYHSVVLALAFSGTGNPLTKVYWADQIYSGWDDVTGSLDARITERTKTWWDGAFVAKGFGYKTRASVWPLLPGSTPVPAIARGLSTSRAPRPQAGDFTIARHTLPFSVAPGSNPGSTAAAALAEANTFVASPGTGVFRLSGADVAARLIALFNSPDLVEQSRLNLCGPAAFFNILLRRDPVSFARYAISLFQTGAGTIGGLSVEPGGDLKGQIYQSAWGCPAADWMTMSALRDSENAFTDYEGTPEETISAATTPAELANWLAATGLYSSVSDEGNWVFTKGVSHATGLAPGPNTDIALLINAHILGTAAAASKKSDEFILSAFPNHFVVLTTPIVERAGMIEFQCWTWGSIYSVSVNRDTFDANYYGAVIATV